MRDTAPLRQLFSDHVEQVCRIPVILNNMPRYYAIVGSALDTALEQAELELRAQNVQFQAEAEAQRGRFAAAASDDDDDDDDDVIPLVPSSYAEYDAATEEEMSNGWSRCPMAEDGEGGGRSGDYR